MQQNHSRSPISLYSPVTIARVFMARFMPRLNELGYSDGQNLHLVYRSAEGHPELLPGLPSELVGIKPDVLVIGFGTVVAKAGKAATDRTPVVFMAVGDPVGAGVVESLARPGGNVTGLSDLAAGLEGSRLQLLREIAPAVSLVAVILNPGTPYTALAYKELEAAAKVAQVELRAFEVPSPAEVAPQLAATKAAGLMSYGTDHGEQWRRGAEIVDRILKGEKLELVFNLKAAKALELTGPPVIMVRADEVIE
jgi:putative ABC transport system substrate-binding protein